MNFKKILTSVVAGASLLTMVGAASAAINGDINIYGASAQYAFWTAQSKTFLEGEGCTGVQSSQTDDAKNWISRATCGGATRYFRVSSKASYDGPLAIQKNSTNTNRVNTCDASGLDYRKLMDEAQVTSWGTGTAATTMPKTAVKCVKVTGGASDVQVTSFVQTSSGMLLGPSTATNNTPVVRDFTGAGAVTSIGLANDCRSLIVPFAFFINNSVTKGGVQVANITTAQARLIFSGQIADWSDLGFDAKPMRACLRHAGSGTHAAIDYDVMRPAALANAEDVLNGYEIWFNDGAKDLMNCVNALNVGGVGYADADQAMGSFGNTHQIKYNGFDATKANIIGGNYDFYTTQNLYFATPAPADMTTLCNFISNPANNVNPYYATVCEMNYLRGDDAAYSTFKGNTCP